MQRSSHEGSSAGAMSPVSPATPRSTEGHLPTLKNHVRPGQVPYVSDRPDHRVPAYPHGVVEYHRTSTEGDYLKKNAVLSAGPDKRISSRHALESDESEAEHAIIKRPIRPW